jgi:DNA modification methylase
MNVQLLQGDCLEILPTLDDKSVDAIITDLPYGTTACSWDVVIPFVPMWEQIKRLCKGAFVTTSSQPFTSLLVASKLDWFRHEWVWEKNLGTRHLDANRRPLLFHENVEVFSQNGYTYNPQKSKGQSNHFSKSKNWKSSNVYHRELKRTENDMSGMKYPRTVIRMDTLQAAIKDHPNQKPVALYEYLIQTYTNPGDTVLDFTMGSGTTGVACAMLNRNFIGIELRPDYFQIAQKRVADAQMQLTMNFDQ